MCTWPRANTEALGVWSILFFAILRKLKREMSAAAENSSERRSFINHREKTSREMFFWPPLLRWGSMAVVSCDADVKTLGHLI